MNIQEFDNKFCRQLNPQQLEAVHSVDGPVLLLAVPGSGKTTVLVTRLGYMVCCRNIDPGKILTMTYTIAATAEMRQRFAASFGQARARAMEFCTINSLATQIIALYARRHGSGQAFPVIESAQAFSLIGQIYQKLNPDYPTDSMIRDILTGISYIKNMMLSPEEIENLDLGIEKLDSLYRDYCKALRDKGLMDFDDQLSYALRILRRYPDLLEHFQDRFPYICVDESQDTSRIQHEIIKLLAAKHGNIFMVGDEDQSIYGFRAAYPEALLSFEADYPGAKLLLMEENYRSTGEIVAAADAFIARNEHRHPKSLRAARGNGQMPQLITTDRRSTQYAYLFEVGRMCRQDTAILYRNNDSALPLIDLFERQGVEYNCRKFEDSFFTHRVVSDIRDIIRFAHEPDNAGLFQSIYYKFSSPISSRAVQLACDDCRRSGQNILQSLCRSTELSAYGKDAALDMLDAFSVLPSLSAEEAIAHIWKRMKYNSYVAKNGLDAGKFDILCELARREKTPKDFLRRLDELRGLIREHKNSPEVKLMLSTIHSSKGLEYERVYLLDMLDGILPSKRKTELKDSEDFHHYEEDRRIYYVAMTRAKDELYLFSCQDHGSEFTSEISSRLPQELVDEKELFSPLKNSLLGKSYSHSVNGRGVVQAQCGDMLLISYPGLLPELKSLPQLMYERDKTVTYSARQNPPTVPPPAAAEEKLKLVIGTKLVHKTFGEGVVLSVKKDIASIMFAGDHGIKRLVISSSLENSLLQVINEKKQM